MLMIAVIIVWWIMDAVFVTDRMTFGGYLKVSAEARISERENCYKLPELRKLSRAHKISRADMLIAGVIKQEIQSIGSHSRKHELNGENYIKEYASKYTKLIVQSNPAM